MVSEQDIHQNETAVADVVLSDEYKSNYWNAYIKRSYENDVTIGVMTPADVPIGKWRLNIDVIKLVGESQTMYRYSIRDPVYILFNPWCKGNNQISRSMR